MAVSEFLFLAVEIQRRFPPSEWRAAIKALPLEAQDECRRYLRGMYYRIQVQAAIQSGRPIPPVPSGI